MSYTKAQMLRDMEVAQEFHRLPILAVCSHRDLHAIRNMSGFCPVAQYGRGMSLVMVKGELGCADGTRFKSATRKGEK